MTRWLLKVKFWLHNIDYRQKKIYYLYALKGGCLSLIYDSIILYCNWRLTCIPQNQYKLTRCKEIKAIQQDALRGIEPQSINCLCPIAIEGYYVPIEPYINHKYHKNENTHSFSANMHKKQDGLWGKIEPNWWMDFAHKQVKVNLQKITQNSRLVMSWNQLREKSSP